MEVSGLYNDDNDDDDNDADDDDDDDGKQHVSPAQARWRLMNFATGFLHCATQHHIA